MAGFPTIVPGADLAQDALKQFSDFANDQLTQLQSHATDLAASVAQPAMEDFKAFSDKLMNGGDTMDSPLNATPDDPRTVATAQAATAGADPANLAWARAHMGASEYQNYCEKFVENANGTTGQFPSALAAAQSAPLETDWSQARPGDTVYYGSAPENGGYGHAAIYSGNGMVVSSAANHETPLRGYFNAPLLGYRPSPDNQSRPPSPDPVHDFLNFAGQKMSDLGSAAQGALSGVTGLNPDQPVGPDNQGIAGTPAAQAAIASSATPPSAQTPGDVANIVSEGAQPIEAAAGALNPKTIGNAIAQKVLDAEGKPMAPEPSIPVVTGAADLASSLTAPGGVLPKAGEFAAAAQATPSLAAVAGPALDAAASTLEASPKVPNWIANAITDVRTNLNALPPVEAAGSGPGAARAGGSLGSNLNPDHLPQDVMPGLDATYDANAAAIDAGRRGVISDQAAKDLAQATGSSVDQIVTKWQPGDAANEETMIALRNALVDRTRAAQTAQDAWAANPTNAAFNAYQDAQTAATNMQTVVQGLTAEAGRALRAIGIDVTDPLVLSKLADDPQFVSTLQQGANLAKPPIGQAARDAAAGSRIYTPTGEVTQAAPQAQDMLPGLEAPSVGSNTVQAASKPFTADAGTAADIASMNEGVKYPVFQGSGPEFGARPDMLGQPNPDVNPNDLLNRVAAATKPVRAVQNMLKQMLVSASVFHPVVLNAQLGRTMLSQGALGEGAKALGTADRMFADVTGNAMRDWMQANRFDLRRAENAGVTLLRGELGPDVAQTGNTLTRTLLSSAGSGLAGYGSAKAQGMSDEDALKRAGLFALGGAGAGALAKPLNAALWQRFVPVAKLETFKLLESKYGAEAAANSVNNLFGGQNLAKMGRSQQVQDIFRTAALAPDWLESWARNVGAAVTPGKEGDIARRYWLTTLTAGAVTMEGLNLAFNGHMTNDNEPGHHFELETTGLLKMLGQNPERRTYLDMLELGPVGSALNAADRGDPGAFLRSHLNVMPSALLDAVQNKASSNGKQIVPTGTPALDAAVPEAAAAASHMVPIGLSGFQNSQVPVAQQVFSGVSGMRSSEGKAFSQDALNLYQNAGMQPPTPTADFAVAGAGKLTLTQPELRSLETMEAPVYNQLAQRLQADPRWATMKPAQQAQVLTAIDREVRPGLERAFMGQLGRDRIVQGLQDYSAKQAQQRQGLRARVSGLPGVVGNDVARLRASLPQFTAPAA